MNLGELGGRIRDRREARGLKQADIANALQISAQAVSKWERGENAPDIGLLPGLAGLLGVSVDWLLGSYGLDKDVFEATIFVSSVLGYARLAQTISLQELAAWSNAILFRLTETVLRHDGVPVKQLGDGLLCFYSGNRHRDRAVASARESVRLASEPLKIALATGPIYLGTLGHPDYAQLDILGEAVNTAFCTTSWLGANGKSGIVVSASVLEGLEEPVELEEIQGVKLYGIDEPVDLYEIVE